jgi:hypothetical protein
VRERVHLNVRKISGFGQYFPALPALTPGSCCIP